MVHFLKHPESKSHEIPYREKYCCHELTNVWGEAKVMMEARNNTQVDKVIKPHKYQEPDYFTARFTPTGFIIEYPFFVD